MSVWFLFRRKLLLTKSEIIISISNSKIYESKNFIVEMFMKKNIVNMGGRVYLFIFHESNNKCNKKFGKIVIRIS